ncbi:MAG TPA: hypothetical protein VKR52_18475 [Terracidiphilus sp.]|nr:hypothetical protein [Terracidiphilus sp.]
MAIQRSRVIGFVLMVLVAPVAVLAQSPAPTASEQKVLDGFRAKAKDYMDREHSLAADKMKPTTDVARLETQRKLLRDAVQQARIHAKQGDFFGEQTAEVFRKILADLFHGPDGKKIEASLNHAEPGAPAQFRVNEEFPNQNGQPIQSVPPTVLKALPALPKGLEYCIAGNTLALHDTSANMVVDYLPNALP